LLGAWRVPDTEQLLYAASALQVMNALGASVTVPHKLAAARACTELSDAARAIGASTVCSSLAAA